MFNYRKLGNRETIDQIEMPLNNQKVLTEILSQNRVVLEANCQIMKLLGSPVLFINEEIEKNKDNK